MPSPDLSPIKAAYTFIVNLGARELLVWIALAFWLVPIMSETTESAALRQTAVIVMGAATGIFIGFHQWRKTKGF